MSDDILFYIIGFSIIGITDILAMMMIFSKGFLEDLITIKKTDLPFDYTKLGATK